VPHPGSSEDLQDGEKVVGADQDDQEVVSTVDGEYHEGYEDGDHVGIPFPL